MSSLVAVATREVVDLFWNFGARRSGKEDAECRGVAGEVTIDGGWDCGGELRDRNPLC